MPAIASPCQEVIAGHKVHNHGWPEYLRANPRPSYSLTKARSSWSRKTCAYYDALTDVAWTRSAFIARPLSRPWRGKLQPILAINGSRLVVAAGNTIYSYRFASSSGEQESAPVISEGLCTLPPTSGTHRDITALTFFDDEKFNNTLYIGYQDGSLERATVIEPSVDGKSPFSLDRNRASPFNQPTDVIESLSASRSYLLSLSAGGHATLSSADPALASSSSIDLSTRSWTSYLCLRSSYPYAAFGTSSTTPLTVYAISEDGLRTRPTAILQPKLMYMSSTAVYGITQAPASSPWGSSPQILVSGWFDGTVRCYDLRLPLHSNNAGQSTSGPALLQPVLSLYNPLSDESIYSVSCGGGFSSYVAAGTARHSVVSFWDIRAPKKGWGVHAPVNDPSPVYSIVLESSRLFGATQSRPFVLDFGPGVTFGTYPQLEGGNPGFYVTTYRHYNFR